MKHSRFTIPLAVVAVAVAVPAASAFADAGSTTVLTYERTGVETIPCGGSTPWYVDELNHEVEHVQPLSDGSLHLVDNVEQTATVHLADGTGPTYTGRTTIHIDGVIPAPGRTSAPFSYVFRSRAGAPDGSTLSIDEVVHAQANPDGTVTVSFDHLRCGL